LLRVILAFAFFIYASISDWKTRRVKDPTWIFLGTVAFVIFILDLSSRDAPLESYLLLVPLAFTFYDIFWDKEKESFKIPRFVGYLLYAITYGFAAYVIVMIVQGTAFWTEDVSGPFIALLMIVFFILLYLFDIIKGGADAKAVICLAILFPWYPVVSSGIPIIEPLFGDALNYFPFALSVLFVAALISIFIPIYFLIKNISNGNKISTRSFVGFTIPMNEVEKHFVWLIEWVEEGKTRFSARKPRSSETLSADLAALQALGIKDAWVTYKIPFIIPLTIGILFVLIIGNPLFLLY